MWGAWGPGQLGAAAQGQLGSWGHPADPRVPYRVASKDSEFEGHFHAEKPRSWDCWSLHLNPSAWNSSGDSTPHPSLGSEVWEGEESQANVVHTAVCPGAESAQGECGLGAPTTDEAQVSASGSWVQETYLSEG